MKLRDATAADANLVAHLHIESWRSAYAAILTASYLESPIEADRRRFWRECFASPAGNLKVMIAEDEGQAIGFVCIFGNADARWGTLIDNLHVLPQAKGRGVGRYLIRAAARWSAENHPDVGLHLWVYEDNAPARAFYERMGGQMVGRLAQPSPDGNVHVDLCYSWPDTALLAR